MLLLPARALVPVCVALIAVNVIGSWALSGVDPVAAGPLLFKLPNATYAPVIMGSLAAILLHRQASFVTLFPVLGAQLAPVAIAALLVGFLHFGPRNLLGLPNLLVHSLMTLLVMSLVVREKTPLSPFLTLPIITRVGVASYGMYLYHLIALDLVNRSLRLVLEEVSRWLSLPLYFILAYLIAELSFRTLEAWFRPSRTAVAHPGEAPLKSAPLPPQS